MHYAISGRTSGRVASPKVDEAWYGSAYPKAADDLAAGRTATFSGHYHRIGGYRGYPPTPRGVRPQDRAPSRSRNGGLWTDQGNAMDLIDGRLDLRKLTQEDAGLLQEWVSDGYVIMPRVVPETLPAPALEDFGVGLPR
jgi:hypothetical protein